MKRFKDILFVVETGKTCEPALERAVTLAESNQASLTVVVVERINADIKMPDSAPMSADLQTMVVNAQKQYLETLVNLAIKPPGFVTPVTIEG